MATKPNKMIFFDKVVSPKGEAMWAHLVEPDEYEGKLTYKIDLLIPVDEATELMDSIQEQAEEALDTLVTKNKKIKPAKKKDCGIKLPYEEHFDDDGNPTDKVKFKFNCKDLDSRGRDQQPAMFDTTPAKIDPVFIGNGSVVKVSFAPRGYYNAAADKAGVTLFLRGVQILELKGGNADVADDFGSEDGDFQADAPVDDSNDF